MVVLFLLATSLSRVCCTIRSDSESRAEVASSSKRICGSLMMARAMAMRWRWPPDSCVPRSPTRVCILSGNPSMKSQLAIFAAAIASSSVAPFFPYMIFSMMVVAKSTGSCATRPTCSRSHWTFSSDASTPSMKTPPLVGE
mmetsp:Transcript_8158/g.14787  ORF Transcript_8158/g.14787 Transcript_8158/m.14787 type:complete len:141 (-) Transcript_8158:376-798(-)